MAPKHVYLHYDSALGKLERRAYGSKGSGETITMFNLDKLRERHR
jgi:hypothetical protein